MNRVQPGKRDAPVLRLWSVWLALAIGLLAIVIAFQRPASLDIGADFDGPHVRGFHDREDASEGRATFRWTTDHSTIRFRGVGKPLAPAVVQIQAASGRGLGSPPVLVDVIVNGYVARHIVPRLRLSSESALYTIEIPPDWVDLSGDI